MTNTMTFIISIIYISMILGIATLIHQRTSQQELSRKFVHIFVGNWILLAFHYFSNVWLACLLPCLFIGINYYTYKSNLISAIHREHDQSLGTVWYAISLFILTFAGWQLHTPALAYIGILSMAYGDGLAALAPRKYAWRFVPQKHIEGSLVVFIATYCIAVITILFSTRDFIFSFALAPVLAIVAMVIELLSPKGLDNLLLPLGLALIYYLALGSQPYVFMLVTLLTLSLLLMAYVKQSLTDDGVISALFTGLCLFQLGIPSIYWALIVFFILGSAISHYGRQRKVFLKQVHVHHGQRNTIQVLCNSLPAVLFVILYQFTHQPAALLAAITVFSAAAADTFASEIGVLTTRSTWSILTLKPLAKGLSGGISLLGCLAAIIGAAIISLTTFINFTLTDYIIIVILGFIGSLIDSWLGARYQAKYINRQGHITEQPTAQRYSGLSWLNNDLVNLLSLIIISIISYLIFSLIH